MLCFAVSAPVTVPISATLVPSAQTWKWAEPVAPDSSSKPTSLANEAYCANRDVDLTGRMRSQSPGVRLLAQDDRH